MLEGAISESVSEANLHRAATSKRRRIFISQRNYDSLRESDSLKVTMTGMTCIQDVVSDELTKVQPKGMTNGSDGEVPVLLAH